MKSGLRQRFLPLDYAQAVFSQFNNLLQGTKSVHDYIEEFYKLMALKSTQETEEQLVTRYVGGLRKAIRDEVELQRLFRLSDAYQLALKVEAKLACGGNKKYASSFYPPKGRESSKIAKDISKASGSNNTSTKASPRSPSSFKCGQPRHLINDCHKRQSGTRLFFDDILVYSQSHNDHVEHLRTILTALRSEQLYVNLKKWSFMTSSLEFHGFLLTSTRIQVDEQKVFEVDCDTSHVGIGGVLSQEGHPIAFFSEKLTEASKNYSTFDVELYVVVQEYTFVLRHESGKCNKVADALSRHVKLLTTMNVQLQGFDAIREMYNNDEDFGQTWKLCKSRPTDYALEDGFLFQGTRLCIPKCSFRG
ncbi:RNA-directed DNA polymerase [Quillaja saponaria]|uniref:RNA-directed DNA polymerase n=1 Tax=Quillaja saponaria TaxID=32244 RepID=A0AAD7PYL2_QUISA|nr:RNA-directed DNA polymerase [Quillaja saponaria]